MKEITVQATDGLKLSVAFFDIDRPTGLVLIIHGMKEHKKRYYHVCKWLNSLGYAAIVSDLRGHGNSVGKDFPLGYMNGTSQLISDQEQIIDHFKSIYPDLKIILIGHSFGSLIARCFLQRHDEEIAKLILSGTVCYRKAVKLALAIGKTVCFFKGKKNQSKLLQKLGDISDDSWVCSNAKTMQEYRSDKLCTGYKYTNGAILTVWEADNEMSKARKYELRNSNLPILSITGGQDPVTGGQKGLSSSIKSLNKIGYKNVSSKVYPTMLHEVFNELDNDVVFNDIKMFLEN